MGTSIFAAWDKCNTQHDGFLYYCFSLHISTYYVCNIVGLHFLQYFVLQHFNSPGSYEIGNNFSMSWKCCLCFISWFHIQVCFTMPKCMKLTQIIRGTNRHYTHLIVVWVGKFYILYKYNLQLSRNSMFFLIVNRLWLLCLFTPKQYNLLLLRLPDWMVLLKCQNHSDIRRAADDVVRVSFDRIS